MSTKSLVVELAGKLAIEYIPKALAGSGIPEPITRIVLETMIGALKEQQDASDEKLRRLVGKYYKTGMDYLSDAKGVQEKRREEWIKLALGEFIKASHVEDTLLVAKSQFFVGVCYDLLNESQIAREWYERAYTSAVQLAAQGLSSPQFEELQQFMNALSRVLPAHGSTLSSRTSILQLTRLPGWGSALRAFQVILDDKKVGTIRQRESLAFKVQAGHHVLYLKIEWASSQRLTFDIAPDEKVIFLCKGNTKGLPVFLRVERGRSSFQPRENGA